MPMTATGTRARGVGSRLRFLRSPRREGRVRARGNPLRRASGRTPPRAASPVFLEIVDESRRDQRAEEQADDDDKQRRLDCEPPEALAVRMQDRQAIGLDDSPDDPREDGEGPERFDRPGTGGAADTRLLEGDGRLARTTDRNTATPPAYAN